jgi:hypothetical protein
MSRRILLVVLSGSAALAMAIPALAQTRATHSSSTRTLRMGGHVRAVLGGSRSAVPAVQGPSTVAFSGFRCQVTIGQGATDTTYHNHFVTDSIEFYIEYHAGGQTLYSVTTNCVGTLPAGTPVASTIVSASTAKCGQFDPFDQTKFITGHGITTTFPDGMFSETCNTPKFH